MQKQTTPVTWVIALAHRNHIKLSRINRVHERFGFTVNDGGMPPFREKGAP